MSNHKTKPQPGDKTTLSRTVREEDVQIFADLSKDYNPVHFDEDFASKTIFGGRIAHGMIGAALISGALTKLMGDGNIWLSATINFKKPVFIGDNLTAHLTISEINRRGVADINVSIVKNDCEEVIGGSVQSMRLIK